MKFYLQVFAWYVGVPVVFWTFVFLIIKESFR